MRKWHDRSSQALSIKLLMVRSNCVSERPSQGWGVAKAGWVRRSGSLAQSCS